MAELAHQTSTTTTTTDVYTTGAGAAGTGAPKNNTVWRGLLNWLSFFFQIFIQLLKGTPSFTTKFLSFRHRFLLSSSSSPSLDSPSFSPLPVDEVELDHLDSPSHLSTTINNNSNNISRDDEGIEKLTVVLDLDETLVSAYETSSLPASIINQAKEAGLLCFELECLSMEKDCDGKPKVNHVTVFERPKLKEFLKQINEFADLILFTAGLEGYARPLVDIIDTENVFKLRLYRPSTCSTSTIELTLNSMFIELCSKVSTNTRRYICKYQIFLAVPLRVLYHVRVNRIPLLVSACSSGQNAKFTYTPKDLTGLFFNSDRKTKEYREHVKDLSCLSKDLTRTVIVDNNPFSFLLQPLNGIPCVPFVAGQPRDDQLLEVLLPLLKHLSLQKDVRPVLYERFHMPEWFEKHGIPACNWTYNSVTQGS